MQHPGTIKGVWSVSTLAVFLAGLCTADNTVEEVVVTTPRTIIETEMLDYGIVRVRYKASTFSFDEVSFVEKTHDVPREASGFGVKLVIKSTPRRRIGVAEAWSHPELLNQRTGQRQKNTILLHTLDPPDVYTFYFPFTEYEQTPAGDWGLQLFLVDEAGPGVQNIEFDDDPVLFIAQGMKPFFKYQFQVQPQ